MTRAQVIRECAEEAHLFARRLADEALCEYVHDDLCGACAIASAYLHTLLDEAGIKSRLVFGDQHCYVRAGRYFIDVTAEQFGHEPIWIGYKPPDTSPQWHEHYSADLHNALRWMEPQWPWDALQIRKFVLKEDV